MSLRLVIALSLALAPIAASAAPAARKSDAASRASAPPPVQVLDYENDTVSGESLRPDHETVATRQAGHRDNLITIRANFVRQMLKMADDV